MAYQSLAILAVVYALTLLFLRQKRPKTTSPTLPVLSTWLPWLGVDNLIALVRSPKDFIENATHLHGPAFMFTMFGKKVAFINHPVTLSHIERQTNAINDIQEMERAVTVSSGLTDPKLVVEVMLGKLIPLITRKLSASSNNNDENAEFYRRLIEDELESLIPAGSESAKMSVWDFMARTTYNASSLFLFGSSFPKDTYEDLTATFYRVVLIASPVGSLPFYEGTRARKRILAALTEWVKPCWEEGADVEEVWPDAHILLKESVNVLKDAGCSVKEAAGIFIGLLFGLHGNIWFHLHQLFGRVLLEPQYKAMIEEEARTSRDITKMKYLESAMWESLRRPFRLVQIRRIVEDMELQVGKERYFVEKGTWFMPKSFNHDPAIFPEPFEFKPNRFLDPSVPKPRPFGEGHRVVSQFVTRIDPETDPGPKCKGRDFSRWSIMIFVSMCFEKFDMTPLDKEGKPLKDLAIERANFKPEGSMVLVDKVDGKDNLWVELKRRSRN